MPSLKAERVSFAYSSATSVLECVSFHLTPGFCGLVGGNGAGKSTLLQLITGNLQPDSGKLIVNPEDARIATCAQSVEELTAEIHQFAIDDSRYARSLRDKLYLDANMLEHWTSLSPGQRRRFQMGAALVTEPDILLLDEPTNHLDDEGRELLVGALKRYRGIGIVVSHDRTLLDTLTTKTMRIRHGQVDTYPGAYSEAREAWRQEEQTALDKVEQQKNRVRSMERRLADARRDQNAAEKSLNARHRMKNKNDHDARSIGRKIAAEWAEAKIGKNVGVIRADLERAKSEINPVEVDKTLGRSVFVDYVRAKAPRLLSLDADSISAGDRLLLRDVHLWIDREDRIHLAGPNGTGKTTLLHALLGAAKVPHDKLLFVPQDISAEQGRMLLQSLTQKPTHERGRILSLVAALGVDPDRLLVSQQPSAGEARKLMIAMGLGRHVWGLVLDEPTNHLDLPSIERLETALAAYPGALLLVSHDDAFAKRCTSVKWNIEDQRVEVQSTSTSKS